MKHREREDVAAAKLAAKDVRGPARQCETGCARLRHLPRLMGRLSSSSRAALAEAGGEIFLAFLLVAGLAIGGSRFAGSIPEVVSANNLGDRVLVEPVRS